VFDPLPGSRVNAAGHFLARQGGLKKVVDNHQAAACSVSDLRSRRMISEFMLRSDDFAAAAICRRSASSRRNFR
jgi:hypothetical protein